MNSFLIFIKALLSGIITGFIISLPLGPAGIESIKRTINHGFKEGYTVSLGAIAGDATYLILINFGLSKLLSSNEKTESFFWVICGIILVLISYSSIKRADSGNKKYKKGKSGSFIFGYFIVITNPVTPSLWITLSGTLIKAWEHTGKVYYITYMTSIITGMLIYFAALDLFAYKGIKFFSPSGTNRTSVYLELLSLGIGFAFIAFGIFMFIRALF